MSTSFRQIRTLSNSSKSPQDKPPVSSSRSPNKVSLPSFDDMLRQLANSQNTTKEKVPESTSSNSSIASMPSPPLSPYNCDDKLYTSSSAPQRSLINSAPNHPIRGAILLTTPTSSTEGLDTNAQKRSIDVLYDQSHSSSSISAGSAFKKQRNDLPNSSILGTKSTKLGDGKALPNYPINNHKHKALTISAWSALQKNPSSFKRNQMDILNLYNEQARKEKEIVPVSALPMIQFPSQPIASGSKIHSRSPSMSPIRSKSYSQGIHLPGVAALDAHIRTSSPRFQNIASNHNTGYPIRNDALPLPSFPGPIATHIQQTPIRPMPNGYVRAQQQIAMGSVVPGRRRSPGFSPPVRPSSSNSGVAQVHDAAYSELEDFAPPISTLPNNNICLETEWKGQPMDLTFDSLIHLLHPAEVVLASTLRLHCDIYLDSKKRFFAEKVRKLRAGLQFRRTDAQKACRIDVNKASRLYAAYEKVGWLHDSNFQRFL